MTVDSKAEFETYWAGQAVWRGASREDKRTSEEARAVAKPYAFNAWIVSRHGMPRPSCHPDTAQVPDDTQEQDRALIGEALAHEVEALHRSGQPLKAGRMEAVLTRLGFEV